MRRDKGLRDTLEEIQRVAANLAHHGRHHAQKAESRAGTVDWYDSDGRRYPGQPGELEEARAILRRLQEAYRVTQASLEQFAEEVEEAHAATA